MPRIAKAESKDRTIAVALTLLGGAGLVFALLRHWNAQEMNPGVEGALTVGILAPILALASGAGFRPTVVMTLPVLAFEAVIAVAAGAGAEALPIVSMQLCCLGFLGFLVAMTEPHEAVASPQRRAERRSLQGAQQAHG